MSVKKPSPTILTLRNGGELQLNEKILSVSPFSETLQPNDTEETHLYSTIRTATASYEVQETAEEVWNAETV